MPLVWRAVRMLQLVGLTVISVVADVSIAQDLEISAVWSHIHGSKHIGTKQICLFHCRCSSPIENS